ncbi:MAG: tetratricopeptide repeat protein, partial [Bacteroidota bacterium]
MFRKAFLSIRLILLFLVIIPVITEAQVKTSSSYKSKKVDFDQLGIIRNQIETDPLTSLDALRDYLKRNFKSITPKDESEVYHLIGKANYQLGQYDLAVENYKKALNIAENRSKLRRRITFKPDLNLYKDVGIAYLANKDYSEAINNLEIYITALGSDNKIEKAQGQSLLGEAYLKNDDLTNALASSESARNTAIELNNLPLRISTELQIGEIYEQDRKFDDALRSYREAYRLAEENNQSDKIKEASEAIGRVLNTQNEVEQALDFKKQVLSNSIQQQDTIWQNSLNLDIAELYINSDRTAEAIPYLEQSVEISEQTGDISQNIKARKSLSDVYATQGNYDQALTNYKDYVKLVDKLYENKQKEIALSNEVQQNLFRNQETINLLEKDMELNEGQIQLLEKDRELKEESLTRQRQLIYGLVLLIVIILGSAFLLYRNVHQKKIANQLLALKSLRSQMNPHFIFNALNSVNSFISKNDTRKANKYLSEFSKLMRTVMENSQNDFVPLAEEIETLSLYLKLEHFRFQDKFNYRFDVPDNLLVDEYRIPPMLIQPYIENAIWHGLRYKEEHGLLVVAIEETDSSLVMIIEDNGIGREKSKALKTVNQKAKKSTGMKNTEDRIRLINDTYGSLINLENSERYLLAFLVSFLDIK